MALLKRSIPKPKLTIVSAQFQGRTRPYNFKTILNLRNGDKCVAEVGPNNNLKTVEIVGVKQPYDSGINYKWIVGRIEKEAMRKAHYERLEILRSKE